MIFDTAQTADPEMLGIWLKWSLVAYRMNLEPARICSKSIYIDSSSIDALYRENGANEQNHTSIDTEQNLDRYIVLGVSSS